MPIKALNILSNAMLCAAAALGTGAVILAAPALEAKYMPVVVDWRAEATRDVGGQTVLRIHGVKARACKYLGEYMSIRTRPDGESRDVASRWEDDPTPGSTRPVGRQDFGTLRLFTSRATPTGAEIVGVARHRCHPGTESLTPIGGPGFVVPPLPIN